MEYSSTTQNRPVADLASRSLGYSQVPLQKRKFSSTRRPVTTRS